METQEAALRAEISLLKQSVKTLEDSLDDAEEDAAKMRLLAGHRLDILQKHGIYIS